MRLAEMKMADKLGIFLDDYFRENDISRGDAGVRYMHFSYTINDANEDLANLLSGKKTAGFGVKKWFDDNLVYKNSIGKILVITDFHGVAKAVVKILSLDTCTYKKFTPKMAKGIGLGDGSLAVWRDKRSELIKRDCEASNSLFNDDTELVIYGFERLFPKVDQEAI